MKGKDQFTKSISQTDPHASRIILHVSPTPGLPAPPTPLLGRFAEVQELQREGLRLARETQEAKNRAGRLRLELEAYLSPPQLVLIREQAQARTFEAVIQELVGNP